MIQEVVTTKGIPAITSDQWHVVHSRLTDVSGKRPYARGIYSEHADRLACQKAAKALRVKLAADGATAPDAERDEVFVCRPRFKTLKLARTRRTEVE